MNPVLTLLLQRLSIGLLVIFAISVLLFVGMDLLPGDFAQAYLGQSATAEAVANLRKEHGLDQPLLTRYIGWLIGVLHGDFGRSFANNASVNVQLFDRFNKTIFLASVAALFAVPISVSLGMISVFFRNKLPDHVINIISLAAISMPEFFIGYLFIMFFALQLGVGDGPPISPTSPIWSLGNARLVALPAATLVVVTLAHMMRMTRAAILNIMDSAYIETAELKGMKMMRIIRKHAAPNAIAPIINVVALNLAYLVVGVVVVEVVFAYPGMGQYFVDAVKVRDIPVVQACGVAFAGVYVILNMLADIGAILANPRLMHPK